MPPEDRCRLLLLADDFTGACDAAAPFGAARSTMVTLSHEAPITADVTALDLDLREVDSDFEASETVERVLRQMATPPERLYLKIDSTLRGPVAGLVRGALAGSDKPVAVIAPAFPEQGRLYANGCVVVHQVIGPSLIDLLGFERTALLGATFARTADDLERAVAQAQTGGAVRVVVDVDQAVGLASIAAAARNHPEWLLVGSAGLSRQLASPSARPALLAGDGPIVVVAGSPHEATHAQLARLPSSPELIVLRTGISAVRDEGQVAAALADDVLRLAGTLRPRALLLAGGATARLVCHRLQVHAVRLTGEWSPGIPVGFLVGGAWDGVLTVTKAGGFGAPDTLLDVAQALGVSSKSH